LKNIDIFIQKKLAPRKKFTNLTYIFKETRLQRVCKCDY